MIDKVAFQSGVFFSLVTLIFTFTIWILAAIHRIRIESVGILHSIGIQLYKVEIKSIQLILGWLPLGSFVKIVGMLDETLDTDSNIHSMTDIPNYEFRSRPLGTRLLVIMTSPLLLSLIGLLLLNVTTLPLLEFLVIYLRVNFFQLPLDAGTPIWDAFYSNPTFLVGSIFLFLGLGNIGTNLGSFLDKHENLTWLLLFLPFSFLLLGLGILRLAWSTFTWINLLYFLLGGILTGIIGFLLALGLAKVLPQA